METIKIELDYDTLADKVVERINAKITEGRKLALREAAAYCGVDPSTLRNWCKRGVIRNYGSVGKHMYMESELRPLIKSKK